MWKYKHSDELYHYGVAGMRWGQRKAKLQLAGASRQRMKYEKEKYKDAKGVQREEQRQAAKDAKLAAGKKRTALILGSIGAIVVGNIATRAITKGKYGLKQVFTGEAFGRKMSKKAKKKPTKKAKKTP